MFKFNTVHIFTNYLKQKLASFNLPKYKVYTKAHQDFFDAHGYEKDIVGTIEYDYTNSFGRTVNSSGFQTTVKYVQYIKDNRIQEYVIQRNSQGNFIRNEDGSLKGIWMNLGSEKNPVVKNYYYNQFDLNYTRHLVIKNNIYDAYTHEYLGDYLRFQRDYNNIDLMPLYNCFSNRICARFNATSEKFNFDASNTEFKIYMFPVKLFKEYTIAIDSEMPVEICCAMYSKYQDTRDKFKSIPDLTYARYNKMLFSQPIKFTSLTTLIEQLSNEVAIDLAQNEADLKMFIKLPQLNTSTITVLEGDYTNYNDTIISLNAEMSKINHAIVNYNTDDKIVEYSHKVVDEEKKALIVWDRKQDFTFFKPITKLQLLETNTYESYPFADRLIEYLVDNVIDNTDTIQDNIKRIKTVIKKQSEELVDNTSLWEDKIQCLAYNSVYPNDHSSLITVGETYKLHDTLGYIDKDMEYNFSIDGTSVAGINIYEEK